MTTEAPSCESLARLLPLELLRALADPTRIAILVGLAAGGAHQTVTEVAARCPVDISVVSRHLKILHRAGVLDYEKRGREAHYEVRIGFLAGRLRDLAGTLEALCQDGRCAIEDDTNKRRGRGRS